MRIGLVLVFFLFFESMVHANDNGFLINFDLNTLTTNGELAYSIQLQGVHVMPGQPLHGDDLGEFDYFLTVSEVTDGKGKLTIEFYEYATREKTSDVVSEIVQEVEFTPGSPATFEAMSDTFGIDLAFSIVERR